MDLIAQCIGGLGVIASIVAFQCKKHKSILFFRLLTEFFFAVQYFLLGAYTGMAADLLGCARNILFARQVKHEKSTRPLAIVFCALFTLFGILTWDGPSTLLVIAAKVLSTLAYGSKNTTVLRCIILCTSTCWLIYNASVFSIAGVLCEAFTLTSILVSLVRFNLLPALRKRAK